jgi:uncharacterized membrane protein YhaH (DUF805 family)
MTDIQPDVPAEADPFRFLTYRGRIGRGLYFLGVLFEFFLLFLALGFLAQAMNSTGSGGGPELFYVMIPLVIWIHSLIATKRMRDAGSSFTTMMVFAFGPFVWTIPAFIMLWFSGDTLETIAGSIWPMVFLVTAGFLLLPGLMSRKAATSDTPA